MTPDQDAQRRAARQYGLITILQALAAGLTRKQVRQRVASGQWLVVARGVYRVAAVAVSEHQRLLAAVLAGPAGTVASHLSAAWLYGLVPAPPAPHITVSPTASAGRAEAVVHRSALANGDRTTVARIPATTPSRVGADCAQLLTDEPLAELVDLIVIRGLASPDRIRRSAGPGRGRTGHGRLVDALAPWTRPIAPESPAEARLLRKLAEWGFPPPVTQYDLLDPTGAFVARLDLAWIADKVAGEYDGMEVHGARRIEPDEHRRERIEALGWRVLGIERGDLAAGRDDLRRRLHGIFAAPAARNL